MVLKEKRKYLQMDSSRKSMYPFRKSLEPSWVSGNLPEARAKQDEKNG